MPQHDDAHSDAVNCKVWLWSTCMTRNLATACDCHTLQLPQQFAMLNSPRLQAPLHLAQADMMQTLCGVNKHQAWRMFTCQHGSCLVA